MLKATIESSSLSLDLDEISADGEGVQALAGMLGLGLPPVDVQWSEGAGDGATYRSTRVLPRDVDIPIHIFVDNRDALKAKLRTLAQILAGKFIVKLWESSTSYVWSEFVRVGGGTYALGGDSDNGTNGETEFSSIVTLRAGNPYWLHQDALSSVTLDVGEQSKPLTNPGSVDAVPVFKLTGPAAGVKLTGPDGTSFSWIGDLLTGSTLTIDPATGLVMDNDGNNRYSGLSYAPKFWRVPPDESTAIVEILDRGPSVRQNYETNPTFGTNTVSPWVADSDFPTTAISASGGRLLIGPASAPDSGGASVTTKQRAQRTLSGLPAGSQFVLRMNVQRVGGYAEAPRLELRGTDINELYLTADGNADSTVREFVIPFTVPEDGQVTYTVQAGCTLRPPIKSDQVAVDRIYVGPIGAYFDGSTAATSNETYAWVGTPNASKSAATELVSPPPSLTIEWLPREWMVV